MNNLSNSIKELILFCFLVALFIALGLTVPHCDAIRLKAKTECFEKLKSPECWK